MGITKRNAASLLRAGANRIETFGLAKGAYRKRGAFCALGAVGQRKYGDSAHDCMWLENPLADFAVTAVETYMGLSALSEWNDQPKRTKSDVVSAFRRTARWLEHGGTLLGYKYGENKGCFWTGTYA